MPWPTPGVPCAKTASVRRRSWTTSGKLIGLVSERGLLTAIDVEDGQVIAARRRKVRGVMTTPVVAAAPTNDIRRIASVMLDRGVDGVPVIAETGRIVDSFPGATSCAQWLPIRP